MAQALEGIRILDLSRIWAGPYATKLMADMGADIIKVESVDRMDTTRGGIRPPAGSGNYPEGEPGEDPWNRNGWFNSLHLSKYGVTINLAKPSGKELFAHLVTISDAVIENYRLGVLARLGFDYEKLRSLRPDIVYISMPAFGNKGRWKGFVQYGIGQEQLSGMADMTGYLDENGPMKSGINHGDPITGSHATGALLASLLYRRRTGRGVYVDLSQLDSSVSLIGDAILGYQMNKRNPERRGNRHPYMAPHGIYRCRGEEEQWVAIAVASDAEWQRLCAAIGRPGLADDERYADVLSRWRLQDELDAVLSEWTQDKDSNDVMQVLQAVGIAATPVESAEMIFDDPHYQERGLMELVDHPSTGPQFMPGISWKMSKTPGGVRWPTPRLGEHNETIFGELLGLDGAELTELEAEGVIGKVPTRDN